MEGCCGCRPLSPAVFPPNLREPGLPALDLFDLDEHFAGEKVQLAQITNKCSDDDLAYYIKECGQILGVSADVSQAQHERSESINRNAMNDTQRDEYDAKTVLECIFAKIVKFKMTEV